MDWGALNFNDITQGLTNAVSLYDKVNTAKASIALSQQNLAMRLAESKANIAVINAGAPVPAYAAPVPVKAASSNKMLYIGGGIVALVGVLFLVRRK
jgi:hypothetical protein